MVRTSDFEAVGPGSIPHREFCIFFAHFSNFPNFQGLFPLSVKIGKDRTFSVLLYKPQRVARYKSHSRALTCSMCHFGIENRNF